MAVYLLDTDTITLLRRRDARVSARVAAASPGDVIAASVISVEEQVGGWYTALRAAKRSDQLEDAYRELAETVRFYGRVPVVDFTRAAITTAERLLRAKLNVRRNDLRIAAIALEAGAVVVTANVRDFGRVPGLACEDWSAPVP